MSQAGSGSAAFDLVIIGAGLHGLSSAWQALRLGASRILVLEQFSAGTDRGSSHGHSRITRSSYAVPAYIGLVREAMREDWPALERDAGRKLIHKKDGCFFGPSGGPIDAFARAVAESGAEVTVLPPDEATKRFAMLRFEQKDLVLYDRTAGLVAAAETIEALARISKEGGAEIREKTLVRAIRRDRHPIVVESSAGEISTDRLIVTAGPWTSALIPELAPALTPIRQTVAFVEFAAMQGQPPLDGFPVFAFVDEGENGLWYGLPEYGRKGMKVGRHVVSGAPDDPDVAGAPDPAALYDLLEFLRRRFVPGPASVLHAETCFYTATANEDYVIDLLPGDPRIAVGAGFSGHGFKLGPLTGRLLAELVLTGRSTSPTFEAEKARFRFRSLASPPSSGGRCHRGS